jgi:hypothetical protein
MKTNKLVKREMHKPHRRGKGNLAVYILRKIYDYEPSQDMEIRRLLAVMASQTNEAWAQGFVERLAAFWEAKITYHLDAIWRAIRDKTLTVEERQTQAEAAAEVGQLIDFAVREMQSLTVYKHAESFLGSARLRLHLETLENHLEDPPLPSEARLTNRPYSEGESQLVIQKIGPAEQKAVKDAIIKPLPQLDDDDLCGWQLRSAGFVGGWPAGRLVVAGWNLPVVETEEGEFIVPIEQMLIDFGGCPLGLVYDSRQWRQGLGYNARGKSCTHCWKKDFCPGNEYLRAWSLGELAMKLQFAWQHRHDILTVIPEFRQKLISQKKS